MSYNYVVIGMTTRTDLSVPHIHRYSYIFMCTYAHV